MKREAAVTWRSIVLAALAAGATAFLPGEVRAGDELTLRVNDARAEPGGLAAVVVRTYASRGLEQGEICLTTSGGAVKSALLGKGGSESAPKPFTALEAVAVLSSSGDATFQAAFDDESQMALLRFSSPSGTVNGGDGPLAVFYFRVSSDFAFESEFVIGIDLGGTFVVDAGGEPVEVEPRAGKLEIRPDD